MGNLYREDGCKGREYDRGGRLLWDGEYHYRYDCEGNLVHKSRRDVSVPENGHTGKKGWLGMLFSADDADTKDNGRNETTRSPAGSRATPATSGRPTVCLPG
ncbi:hypothetical protein NXW90_00165 [Bacteroides fragilis]|nr:hypothetical protein [Bacteroides fragilis]